MDNIETRKMQAMGYAMGYADAEMHNRTGQTDGAALSRCYEFMAYVMGEGKDLSLQDAYQSWRDTLPYRQLN